MPPEKDRAASTGNIHKTFDEGRTGSSEDMIAERQTHTHRQTRSSQYSAPLSEAK